jgi:P pilus assembly chaperone PapD
VKDFVIYRPLSLQPGQTQVVRLVATATTQESEFSFEISSQLASKVNNQFVKKINKFFFTCL